MGKFSYDEQDPYAGLYRFRRPRPLWPLALVFAGAVGVGAALASLLK